MPELLDDQYRRLKAIASETLGGEPVGSLISEMALHSREILCHVRRLTYTSDVAGKRYIGFSESVDSRPVNEAIYVDDDAEFDGLLESFRNGFQDTPANDIVKSVYTIAYSVFAANDVYEVGRKTSATFFEILIGHIVARVLGVEPRKKVKIPETGADLTTDYVFDLGRRRRKIHLPIKTSTRERGVQAWVHQLVLDRIFGDGIYKGVLVVAAETKRASKTGVIIEICVPQQFQMFQSRVARLSRIYYLDPPDKYLELAGAEELNRVEVKSFGKAIAELPRILRS
jgi:hypothetical protein